MAYPVTFGTQTSPEPMSNLDLMFNQVGAMIQIPCSASGTNAVSLTPLVNCPALSSYNELGGYRFRAVGTSSGAVTAQYNGLGFLPVYHADGVTQANVSDIVSGQQYVLMFSQALNSGGGGFFFESPSQPVVTQPWAPPGGRVTLASATPVMVATVASSQNIYYAPYVSPFVSIYNGSTVQQYQFTSSLSDQVGLTLAMGGGAQWFANTPVDIFAYLNSGVPALCGVRWTNTTTRATTLSVFGGFLTNSGSATALTGPATAFTLPTNQGTWLGTIHVGAVAGQSLWVFGGAASGGSTGQFFCYNYYNQVNFNTIVTDNGAGYTYTSATIRQARASGGNQVTLLQGSSERNVTASYSARSATTAVANASVSTGIGVGVTNAFYAYSFFNSTNAGTSQSIRQPSPATVNFTGVSAIAALEASDGTNANTFDTVGDNQLFVSFWA